MVIIRRPVARYAKLIEATYSWCFFFVVGFNMFLITVTGLQVRIAACDVQFSILTSITDRFRLS